MHGPENNSKNETGGQGRHSHRQITPNTHPTSAAKRPEPAEHLLHLRTILGNTKPTLGFPFQRIGEHGGVAVQGVRHGADTHAAGDVSVVGERAERSRRGDAWFDAGDGGVQAEGFHDDGVEEGEGVDRFGGGEREGGGGEGRGWLGGL